MSVKVGDKLLLVPTRSTPYEVEVTKVGRKWAYVSRPGFSYRECRFDHTDSRWPVDGNGHNPCGSIYESAAEYKAAVERCKAERALRMATQWSVPITVTTDDFREAARLLGVLARFEEEMGK